MDASPVSRSATRAWFGGILVVSLAVTLWWWVLLSGVGALTGAEYSRGAHIVRALGATLFTVALVAWALRRPVRRSWSDLGVDGPGTGWRQFVFGAACWAIPAMVTLLVLLGVGWAELSVQASVAKTLVAALGSVVLVLLYEAVPEELVFRGYLFTALSERFSPFWSVLGQAVLFMGWGALIGAAGSVDRVVLFGVFAVVLGAMRAVTGSVWVCAGFHTAFQFTAQFLGTQWTQVRLHDPDLAVASLAFVAVPFLCVAAPLWWVSRRRPVRVFGRAA
ncbi:CPBP family intramembrane glutamic endopeptidase [Nocardia callitridis]|uniref:Type II CAAX endopeptidase family protein n=1 Tax=Nocardia callitridis TaxID=648753 RepID=A0ABP9KEP1_9NOCA